MMRFVWVQTPFISYEEENNFEMHMRVALVFVLLFFFAVDVDWGLAHYRADDLSGRNYELAIEVR